MKLFRKVLILSHRYLGIALGLLIVVWFASGMVMMYDGGMPRLTPEVRLDRLSTLDVSRVRLTVAEAADRAGLDAPGRVALSVVMDRPAYRFPGRPPTIVFADTGDVLFDITVAQSWTIAARFARLPETDLTYSRTLTTVDQWTLGQNRQLPLHKFRVNDGNGTDLYVSPQTGEVVTLTTSRSRLVAWLGTIPHWLYFAALRVHQEVWYQIMVWTAAFACVLAVLGLILGVTQFRRQKPFRLAESIPYSGWMRWHYITGVIFGVFTLTWAFSGLLSLEPFEWTQATGLEVRQDVFTGGPLELSRFPNLDPAKWDRILEGRAVKEIEFLRIQDAPYYLVHHAPSAQTTQAERQHQPYIVTGRADSSRLLVAADTFEIRREPFTVESLTGRLQAAVPDAAIVEQQLLSQYDSYYYSRAQQIPLPVLRVKFNDPAQTWFYIDPAMSQVLGQVHRLSRVERWLFNGLHSLDFAFWYNSPAWDVAMITLSLGGLASTGIGLFLGIRRMGRGARRRTAAAWVDAPQVPDPGSSLPSIPR